jgi:hypothetical protein
MRTAGYEEENVPSIVGMWHVIFTAKTSNGKDIPETVVDNALAVWHSDKTEIMNSVRPPQDGNFCLGVWEQTGRNAYYLNHFPWFANEFPNDEQWDRGAPRSDSHHRNHHIRLRLSLLRHLYAGCLRYFGKGLPVVHRRGHGDPGYNNYNSPRFAVSRS